MPLDRNRCRPLLQNFDFRTLFIDELGWDTHRASLEIIIKNGEVRLDAICNKRGFVVWHCTTPAGGAFPDSNARRRIEREATKAAHEHLIIFTDAAKSRQIWQWVRRQPGEPLRVREIEWTSGQSGEIILQNLAPLFVSIEDEETLTLLDVVSRAGANVNDRIAKKFYTEFRKQHESFLSFITGIPNKGDHEWYASVMLNRLMFIYFVQKKGFLDGDIDYLRNRLAQLQAKNKGDKFYSFYRAFLLRLFHEGLGGKGRKSELEKLIGRVPYLNGGIFDVHQLERDYGDDIQIPDKAFEAIFDYFDRYQWQLDERPLSNDNEINPDVLGYIFEKYINQKQMGAYYTKEDITEYIGKNCIIPFLFDSVRAKCKVAFENTDSPTVWDLLRENPDRYVYPAVRHGCQLDLPTEIADGLDTKMPNLIERRKPWNKPAPSSHALPTEIWREVIARRQRYEEVREKIAAGEVSEINDFITLNLDVRQFAQDVIQNCEGPDLLIAFWQCLNSITILDPTGGSGAFVFAALNILEPLYEGCLDRIEGFLAEWGEHGKKNHPNYHKKFSEIRDAIAAHPNRRYFVLKSIILNNLYAVDIMEEAVEICKLRLFLKLAAQVGADASKDNYGIEPLPDIDFNIRAGNTLVGYATYQEVQRAIDRDSDGQAKMQFDNAADKIAIKAADLQQTFDTFRLLQTQGDGTIPATHKQELQKRLKSLEEELNHHLASEYGVKVSDIATYNKWLQSHQPFHWFIQFYGIMQSGGFDVIIGNPPYLDLKQLSSYTPKNYTTLPTKNLYPLLMERSILLTAICGRLGFIVPVSSISTDGYSKLQDIVLKMPGHFSSYDDRPSRLFDGLEHIQLTIHLLENRIVKKPNHLVTECYRWSAVERDNLFPTIEYENIEADYLQGCIPKISNRHEHAILQKLWSDCKSLGAQTFAASDNKTYYSRKVHNFLQALDFIPKVYDGKGNLRPPSELKALTFARTAEAAAAFCILNSTLFRWFINVFSDCRHVNKREVEGFRCDLQRFLARHLDTVIELGAQLSKSLEKTSEFRDMKFKHDRLRVQCIIPKHSKPIIDEIDTVLARHYDFTDEELDFIINYDIKYRMGRNTETDDE
jgi:hypothetical protein